MAPARHAQVGFFMLAAYPLFFELCMETTFPIPEAVSSGVLIMIQAAIQAVFLAVPVEGIGTHWMNYSVIISPLVCAIVLLFFKEKYQRLNMDLAESESRNTSRRPSDPFRPSASLPSSAHSCNGIPALF